tara:strand:+ start:1290 stop:1460 length:171 start_codon:yes stop_codon:yes gene_type:complete
MDLDLQIFERQEPTFAKKKENQKFWYFLKYTTNCGYKNLLPQQVVVEFYFYPSYLS